ncbi:sensor signal transduction histidine kinase [Beggiatoa sp. PS]|nr:sensor signal transduction histidine kinase [Beggiatoa sp. PS]
MLQYLDSNHLLKLNTTFSLSEFPNLLSTLQETLELNQITLFMDDSLAEKTLLLSKEGLELGLRELLTNAKKFHPQQSPQIDISIKPIDTKNIVLSISDNGKNLPSEVLTQVWTPYFQNEKFFTGEVKGMGLGLPMIARLVWGCGGNCSLHNRDDQPGVTIELTLPLTSNENG